MKKRLSAIFSFLFLLGDLFLLNIAIFISYSFTKQSNLDNEIANEVYLFIFSNLGWFFLLLILNPFGNSASSKFKQHFQSIVSFVFVQLLALISLVLFFNKGYSAIQLMLYYCLFIPSAVAWRVLYLYVIGRVVRGTHRSVNYIIVGHSELAVRLRRNFRLHPEYGYKFLGFVGQETNNPHTIPYHMIDEFCSRTNVQEIFCCWPDTNTSELKKIIDLGLNRFIKVKLVKDSNELSEIGIPFEKLEKVPVVDISAIPLDDSFNQLLKRVFDLSFTILIAIAVLSWLLPIIAILIKLTSRGPVLFKQIRAGKGNQPFICLKFRTMYTQQNSEFVQATKDDSRITPIGKFLRKTSLDEFPQFINVLIGEMSIVGPRPHPIKLNDDFAHKIAKLMSRHYVKPGITGLAQCLGYRGETKNFSEMRNRITLDRFYVEKWSLLFDVRIIFQTAVSLVRGSEKAY